MMMKKLGFRGTLAVSVIAVTVPAQADTLREALVRAYRSNPTITVERASLRANDENVPIARAGGLPNLSSGANYTENVRTASNAFRSPNRQVTAGVDLTVPIYTGGLVRNSVRAAEERVNAGRSQLRSVESSVFNDAVSVYMDVIRDEAIVGLNQQNVRVLEVNLQAIRDRFEVGDLTRTDVAQSEARLAVAQSRLREAEAQLIGSRENYVRIIGAPGGVLEAPPSLPNLPASPDAAVTVALADNPSLEGARRFSQAARYDVGVAKAGRLPRLNAVAGGDYFTYLGSSGSGSGARVDQSGTSATAGLSLSLPLFQGGRPSAQIRQAEARRAVAIEDSTNAERSVVAQTRANFAFWQSALRVIESADIAVNANKLSLEGVRAENSVGTRTILDILNAEQELLNSQVQLVSARRDAYVAGFALLVSMGHAQAEDLGLQSDGPLYDPTVNYNRVRKTISDWRSDGDPAPVATRTVDSPAQTPVVRANPEFSDPALQRPVDTVRPNPAGERR